MSKLDIFVLEQRQKVLQAQLKLVVKKGTSKGGNRKEYQKLKKRIDRLRGWIDELESFEQYRRRNGDQISFTQFLRTNHNHKPMKNERMRKGFL